MGMLARLGVVLGLDSGEFKQGIESAEKKLDQFGERLPAIGAAGVAAFAAMSYSAIKFADELSDVAKANDMTVESILKLQNALQESGGEAANAGKMLDSLTNFIDKAASGNKEAQESFAEMGVSLKDLGSLSNEQLLNKVASSLSEIDDTVTRNAKGFEAFGKAAKGVDFRSFNNEIENGHHLTTEWSKSITDAADAWGRFEKAYHDFQTQFSAGLGSTLKMTLDYFDELFSKSNIVFESVKVGFQTIAVLASDFVFVIQGLNRQLQMTMLLFKSFIPGSDVEGKWSAYIEEGIRAREKLDEFQRRVMGGGGGYGGGASNFKDPRRLDNAQTGTGPIRKVTDWKDKEAEREAARLAKEAAREAARLAKEQERLDKMLAVTQLISIEYERGLKFNLANLKTQGEMAFMTENQRKIQEAMNSVANDVNQKLNEIQKKREDAAANGADNRILDELDAQKKKVQELGEAYKELSRIEIESQIAAQSTFEFGWNKAFAQYIEDSENAAKRGQEVFQTVTGNMNAAIDNFVRTGKLSFKDLAGSIIRDLIAIQMKAQAVSIFSMMFGGKYTPGSSSFVGPMPAKADGGYVAANEPYMVGERGPEMFIPQGAGTIIPNNRMQSGGVGGQTVNNFTINAIDTKSFEDRLYNSSTAVWAANQYANKSLAAVGGRS